MTTHFYAFGSICRGEIDKSSDVDLLACVSELSPHIDTDKFSVYKHERICGLWNEGNPFAWHLHLESKLLYSSDGTDFIMALGEPKPYEAGFADCKKFAQLFSDSFEQLAKTQTNATFNISCMFLGARNFATCYSLWRGSPIFSRKSPLLIDVPLRITEEAYDVFTRARVLSTRGIGRMLSHEDTLLALREGPSIQAWMSDLLKGING